MKKLEITGLVLAALLLFVWPVSHTISVRDTLLFACLVIFGYLAYRRRPLGGVAPLKVPALLFAALTIWMLIGAFFISNETAWSFSEIRGQWFKGIAALLVGAWMATTGRTDDDRTRILTVFASVLLVQVLYVDFLSLQPLFRTGVIGRRMMIMDDGPDKTNYVTNLLLVFLFVEAFLRITYRKRFLRFNNMMLGLLVLAALLGEYVTSMRNGVMELSAVLLVLAIVFVLENRRRVSRPVLVTGVAVLVVVPAVMGYLNYRSDPRWQTLLQTIPVALNTHDHKGWLDPRKYGFPTLPNGAPVEASAYMRISAIKEGLLLVAEHPLGTGFGRNAYGHGLKQKYGAEGLGHSHSGILDMAIGTGIPGAILWVAFLASLIAMAWRRFRQSPGYAPLLLLLLVTGFSFRMLVDSIIRDHMLQEFLFFSGLLAVMAVTPAAPAGAVPPKRS